MGEEFRQRSIGALRRSLAMLYDDGRRDAARPRICVVVDCGVWWVVLVVAIYFSFQGVKYLLEGVPKIKFVKSFLPMARTYV